MDLKNQALQGLTQEVLLKKLQGLKDELRRASEGSDLELLELEAEDEHLQFRIHEIEQQLHQLKVELGSLQERKASGKKELLSIEQKRNILLDQEAFLKGIFSVERARFFTMSMNDFAHRLGVGSLSVEVEVKKSADAVSFLFQGKKYAFLKGFDQQYYFYPEAVGEGFLECNSGEGCSGV